MLGIEMSVREGLLLRIEDDSGNAGEGEIAPFTGLHEETLEQAASRISSMFQGENPTQSWLPSVRFGLEAAWSTLGASRQGKTVLQAMNPSTTHVPVNALLPVRVLTQAGLKGEKGILGKECARIQKTGYKCLKLKAGRHMVEEDISTLRMLHELLEDSVSLRVDANRAWSIKDALVFADGVRDISLEYCEEPLKNPAALEELYKKTGMPLALDETLWNKPDPATLPWHAIHSLVLKPGRLGGWNKTRNWVNEARARKVGVTFSSSFESGVGLAWIALMSACLSDSPLPAGLDTFQWFEHDLIEPPFELKNGSFVIPENWPSVLPERMQLVDEGETSFFTVHEDDIRVLNG